MLVCRCLTTQVVDEEAEYKEINNKLGAECNMAQHKLFALNEKLACFDDLQAEVRQMRAEAKQNQDARADLWSKVERNNKSNAQSISASVSRNKALISETDELRA